MIKRKINAEYLKKILASDVRKTNLDTLDLTEAMKRFATEYLSGIMSLEIVGYANGYVTLNMQVFSYLVRLLCEDAEDEPVRCTVSLTDKMTIETTYPGIKNHELTAYLIRVAKLVGFSVERVGDILFFSIDIIPSTVMKIYATSTDEIMDWLVTTHKM